jgi:hypothetical protein
MIESKFAKVHCAFSNRNFHSKMPLVLTRARFNRIPLGCPLPLTVRTFYDVATLKAEGFFRRQQLSTELWKIKRRGGCMIASTTEGGEFGPNGGAMGVLSGAGGGGGAGGRSASTAADAEVAESSVPLVAADLRANLINRKRHRGERRSSRQLERHIRHVASTIDPDNTDSSSCASSEDERDENPLAHGPIAGLHRLQARWDGDRSVIGWRWSWLQLRLEALEEQIEEHDTLLAQIRARNTPFLFEGDPVTESARVAASEAAVAAATGAVAPVGGNAGAASKSGPAMEEDTPKVATPMAVDAAPPSPTAAAAPTHTPDDIAVTVADAGCARARGLDDSSRKRRKLITASTLRPKTQAPLNKSATPLGHSDRNAIRARAALLDRKFHLVLSLLTDAPSAVLGKARAHRRMQLDALRGINRQPTQQQRLMQQQHHHQHMLLRQQQHKQQQQQQQQQQQEQGDGHQQGQGQGQGQQQGQQQQQQQQQPTLGGTASQQPKQKVIKPDADQQKPLKLVMKLPSFPLKSEPGT